MINKRIAFYSYLLGGLVSSIEIAWTYILIDVLNNYSSYKDSLSRDEALVISLGFCALAIRYLISPLFQKYSLILLSRSLAEMLNNEAAYMLNSVRHVLSSRNTSSLQSEAIYHPQVIYHQLLSPLQTLFIESAVAISLIIIVLYKTDNPVIAGIPIIFLTILSLVLIKVFKKYQSKISEMVNLSNSRINEYFFELINGIRDILIYKSSDLIKLKIKNEAATFSKMQALISFNANIPRLIIEGALSGLVFLVFLFSDQEINLGMVTTLILVGFRLAQSIGRIVSSFNSFQLAKNSLVRSKQNILEHASPCNLSERKFVYSNVNKIELNRIYLKSPGNEKKDLIEGLSHIFCSGKINLITGKSGSGKSSLVDAILGFREFAKGEFIVSLTDQEIAEKADQIFAYCGQYPYIFSGTLIDNLKIGNKGNIDSLLLEKIIPKAEIDPEYILAEAGRNISGGQRQRIGVLRCILSQRPILVFDEPTASLDESSANTVISEIEKISQDGSKIVIVVTHDSRFLSRNSIILNLDSI